MNLKLSFSWIGLVVFALPMIINIAYAVFPPAKKSGADRCRRTLDRDRRADQPHCVPCGDHASGKPQGCRDTQCMALALGRFPCSLLYRMDQIFCGRTGDPFAEPPVSLCSHAPCGFSRAVLFVRRRLASQHSRRDTNDCFRCGASYGFN